MQEASATLDAFHNMYFLPVASPGHPSPEMLLTAPIQIPPDAPSSVAHGNMLSEVSRHPVPVCAVPLNDHSVLPEGFSTTPAVLNTAGAPGGAASEVPGDAPGGSLEQAGPAAPPAAAAVCASVPVRRVSQTGSQGKPQPSAPAGAQAVSQQDIAAVHAWLTEKVSMARCGLCVSSAKVCPLAVVLREDLPIDC